MPRAVIYRRVSTDEQAESGLGLEAQLAACQATAARMAWEIVTIPEDSMSGGLPLEKRTILLDALAELGRGDVLLVAKRDRLSRGDIMTTAMIEAAVQRAGARIVSAAGEGTEADDPASVLMRHIIDAFGEYKHCSSRPAPGRPSRPRRPAASGTDRSPTAAAWPATASGSSPTRTRPRRSR